MFLTTLFEDPVRYALVVAVIVVSVTLHELGHVLAASWEGDATPKIRGHMTWNPLVHMGWTGVGLALVFGMSFGQTPVTPARFRHRRWGEVIVSAAGPLVNLALAAVAAVVVTGLVKFAPAAAESAAPTRLAAQFWDMVLVYNSMLFLFNLIPLPPLDGFGVVEGTVNLGEVGPTLRRLFPWTLIGAWLLFSSAPFRTMLFGLIDHLAHAARTCWGVL